MDAMDAIWAQHIYDVSLLFKTQLCWQFLRMRTCTRERCCFAHGVCGVSGLLTRRRAPDPIQRESDTTRRGVRMVY